MQKKIFGLSLSLAVPLIYILFVSPIFLKPHVNGPTSALIDFAVLWVLALGMLFFTQSIEKLSLTTIGWKPLSLKSIFTAMGLGILLSLLVPIFTLAVSKVFPPSDTGSITQVTSNFSWWILLLSVLTAGITEEILFRGYALERLYEITSNKWVSGLISLIFFVAIHSAGWNIAHVVGVVIPLGIILTGLYFWQRNLSFMMIVHVVIDLPLVFIVLLR
ncbi:MAG TPA: type II CAAX endopeptidase family protein [Anaerolineales bacterium]|jgi:membrane protease YdiL (CAAX protease family)|nr:hypothetical protein [Anaerolineae bacterium]HRJ56612.1 type II CAAX endopeptidase family protein [Anaerolineales bacterium]HRK87650.1 type II CAAX endopeptidase family protein [Anaerolineales bacterium]